MCLLSKGKKKRVLDIGAKSEQVTFEAVVTRNIFGGLYEMACVCPMYTLIKCVKTVLLVGSANIN